MNIEQKCINLQFHYFPNGIFGPIHNWIWKGVPLSKMKLQSKEVIDYAIKLDELIFEADEAECLTSNCKYIRECKKWLMERVNE